MENYKHIPLEFRGFEFDLEVYYTTTEYNFSDEVQGVTIDFDYRDLHNPRRATQSQHVCKSYIGRTLR